MSNQSDDVALSLEHILLGISDSLTEAQATLKNVEPYDQYGRPNVVYELPYLDFKLQVTSEFQTTSELITSESPIYNHRYFVRYKPVNTKEITTTDQSSITSTISGRFVANVPNQGLPQIFLNLETEKLSLVDGWQKYKLSVLLSNSINERMTGHTIELNFDKSKSKLISGIELVSEPVLVEAEGLTDDQGQLEFEVMLPQIDYNNSRTFVFIVNAGTVYKEFSISKG